MVNFDETEQGIILRRRTTEEGVDADLPQSGSCGRVLGVLDIQSTGVGERTLTINCRAVMDKWTLSETELSCLQAQDEPYVISIYFGQGAGETCLQIK